MEWHNKVALYGTMRLSKAMTKLSKSDPNSERNFGEKFFDQWWGISIKFFCPVSLCYLIAYTVIADIRNNYGNYHVGWQIIGLIIPFAGLVVFVWSLFMCTEQDTFQHDIHHCIDAVERGEWKDNVEMKDRKVEEPTKAQDGDTANQVQ